MEYLPTASDTVRVGLAYSPTVSEFVQQNPGLVDYVEVPFEQLRHDASSAAIQELIPVVLHCASMSVAGFVPPSDETVNAIALAAAQTRTPWIGEHLAFISAEGLTAEAQSQPATTLTYTVCPQLSEETIQRVTENVLALQGKLDAPLVLENSPQYLQVPGSTLRMVEFIARVFERCSAGLLLDLSHFSISMLNTGVAPADAIDDLPLARVVEIHLSGYASEGGVFWDNHAIPAPEVTFQLLERVLKRVKPRAVTLEYNWSPRFPKDLLRAHILRVRRLLGQA
jgi:uncharacterized protein (UPF0276 family)